MSVLDERNLRDFYTYKLRRKETEMDGGLEILGGSDEVAVFYEGMSLYAFYFENLSWKWLKL